jgi:hypothetical protein
MSRPIKARRELEDALPVIVPQNNKPLVEVSPGASTAASGTSDRHSAGSAKGAASRTVRLTSTIGARWLFSRGSARRLLTLQRLVLPERG